MLVLRQHSTLLKPERGHEGPGTVDQGLARDLDQGGEVAEGVMFGEQGDSLREMLNGKKHISKNSNWHYDYFRGLMAQ